MEIKSPQKIILDSDVISHFIKGKNLLLLARMYPNRIVILDVVKNEISLNRNSIYQVEINNLLRVSGVHSIQLPTDMNIVREYAQLKKRFGKGESACMALAKYDTQYMIASSNLKDIKDYCELNKIQYLTTMEILLEACDNNYLTEDECNSFITDVKAKGSKLPVTSIAEFKALNCKNTP